MDGVGSINVDGIVFFLGDVNTALLSIEYEDDVFSPSLIFFSKQIRLDNKSNSAQYKLWAVKVNFLISMNADNRLLERMIKVGHDFVILGFDKAHLFRLIREVY